MGQIRGSFVAFNLQDCSVVFAHAFLRQCKVVVAMSRRVWCLQMLLFLYASMLTSSTYVDFEQCIGVYADFEYVQCIAVTVNQLGAGLLVNAAYNSAAMVVHRRFVVCARAVGSTLTCSL